MKGANDANRAPLAAWVTLLAPGLLVLASIAQLAFTHAGSLNPAKGGGFGLFSTVDKLENRILLASLETPDGDLAIGIVGIDELVHDVASFPSQRKLDHLARWLIASRDAPANATALRVEVWKRTFDPATGMHARVLVAKHSVPLAR